MSKTVLYVFYWLYNLIGFGVIGFAVFWLNSFFNSSLVPKGFKWDADGKLKDDLTANNITHFVLMNIEALVFIFLLYLLNKSYLLHVIKEKSHMALWMGWGMFIVSFIVLSIYLYFIQTQ